jgi:hypothetical protein
MTALYSLDNPNLTASRFTDHPFLMFADERERPENPKEVALEIDREFLNNDNPSRLSMISLNLMMISSW